MYIYIKLINIVKYNKIYLPLFTSKKFYVLINQYENKLFFPLLNIFWIVLNKSRDMYYYLLRKCYILIYSLPKWLLITVGSPTRCCALLFVCSEV